VAEDISHISVLIYFLLINSYFYGNIPSEETGNLLATQKIHHLA
jgi:hypothetical protein